MKNRWISLFLCLLLAATGCQSGETTDTETNAVTTATEQNQTDPAPESETTLQDVLDTLPTADYGGASFNIMQYFVEENHIHNYFEFDTDELNGETLNDAVYNRNLTVEEMYNVVIEGIWDTSPSATTQKNAMAGDAPNHLTADMLGSVTARTTSGCFMDIERLSGLDLSQPWWNEDVNNTYEIAAKLFFITGDYVLFEKQRIMAFVYNRSMADDYGIENLYETVFDGAWTTDKMNTCVAMVRNDLNGDGTMHFNDDCFGLLMGSTTYSPYMLFGMGNRYAAQNEDGTHTMNVINDRMLSSLETLGQTLYTDNVAWGEEITNNWKDGDSPQFVFEDSRALFYYEVIQILRLIEGDISFGVLPSPKYDETQENYQSAVQAASAIAIPVNNAEPEMTATLLQALGAVSHYTTYPAFIEETLKAKKAPDAESSQIVEIIFDGMINDTYITFNIGGLNGIISKNIYNEHGETLVSNIESNRTSIESAYEELLETYRSIGK